MVLGHNSTAAASYSMALGYNSTANAAYSTVLGVYNDPIVAPTNAWNVTDPLLIVGNGTSTTPSNALVILKNGNTKISGSLATGTSTASGLYSTALGQSEATGTGSFAVGSIDVSDGGRHSIASGDNSTALGESTASGYGSTALGVSTASGASSFSLGYLSTASGNLSIASGWASTASGSISSASGVHSTASGDFSTASGIDITSRAYACVSIGKFNDSIASSNTTTWVSTDPIFIIGNGAASSSRSNAYVFYKNGNATMAGTLVQNSDRRLKRDFTPLSNPLDKVLKINGLHYYWSDADRSKNLQTGVIAQEVQAVMPELVEADNKGILSVNYNGIIPYLIESIKILKKENDDLKAKVSKMDALQAKVDELDALKAEVEKIKNAVYGRAEKH